MYKSMVSSSEPKDGLADCSAVTFRIIVFRPFKGEIIQATILHLDAEGMRRTTRRFIVPSFHRSG